MTEIEPLIILEGIDVRDVHHVEFRIGPLDPFEILTSTEFRSPKRVNHQNTHGSSPSLAQASDRMCPLSEGDPAAKMDIYQD